MDRETMRHSGNKKQHARKLFLTNNVPSFLVACQNTGWVSLVTGTGSGDSSRRNSESFARSDGSAFLSLTNFTRPDMTSALDKSSTPESTLRLFASWMSDMVSFGLELTGKGIRYCFEMFTQLASV